MSINTPSTTMNVETTESSDYRSTQTIAHPISKSTYLLAASKKFYPSKALVLIFPSLEGMKLEKYVYALGPKVQPKYITFASRISNNRICIYLSSKSILAEYLTKDDEISINNEIISARRLITSSSRILLSNVYPSIPDETLEAELKNMGFKLLSPVSSVRTGVSNTEYGHIESFRRQVYSTPLQDDTNIPD